jgi:hypothetical protein
MLAQIRAEHAQLQEQNQRDLVENQQPGSVVAPNPYSIRRQQELELQLLNQAQPIIQDTPEPYSSSEPVESTSWDHTNTHSSILSPTERNYQTYPVEPPAVLITALENLRAQGVRRKSRTYARLGRTGRHTTSTPQSQYSPLSPRSSTIPTARTGCYTH